MAQVIHIPAREGRAVHVAAGTSFRVIDTEGRQVVDLFAFNAADISEYVSAEHTRVLVDRLFPRPSEYFVSNRRRPMLLFVRDDSPGIHDMLIAACDPPRYAGLGVAGWHASCQENLLTAMASLGHSQVEVPQSLNLFMNIPVAIDGTISWAQAQTRAGDSATFQAVIDCIIVASACPQDIIVINDNQPTSVALEILDQ